MRDSLHSALCCINTWQNDGYALELEFSASSPLDRSVRVLSLLTLSKPRTGRVILVGWFARRLHADVFIGGSSIKAKVELLFVSEILDRLSDKALDALSSVISSENLTGHDQRFDSRRRYPILDPSQVPRSIETVEIAVMRQAISNTFRSAMNCLDRDDILSLWDEIMAEHIMKL